MYNIYDNDKFENIYDKTKQYLLNSENHTIYNCNLKNDANYIICTDYMLFSVHDLFICADDDCTLNKNGFILKPIGIITGFDYDMTISVYGIFNCNNKIVNKITMLYENNVNNTHAIVCVK